MERAKDVVFNLFTILFFGSVLYSAWLQPSWSTVVPVLAGVFCALIGNPDRFASIKFSLSGIEAKAREIIQKVEVSQREFQNIATMVGELFVELNASVGRWDTGSGAERDKRKSRVLDALQSIGLSEQELVRISSIDKPWNIIDYVNGIITRAAKAVPKDLKTEWNEIVTPILIAATNRNHPKVSQILPKRCFGRSYQRSNKITRIIYGEHGGRPYGPIGMHGSKLSRFTKARRMG